VHEDLGPLSASAATTNTVVAAATPVTISTWYSAASTATAVSATVSTGESTASA
tara:strand:- start:4094 stop:4255 length:162 start_codon:yes stop_codon:yes gene_type:complete